MGIDIKTTTSIYNGETFISEHTNKPIDVDSTEDKRTPIFWCDICQVRLRTAHTAIQHVGGRPHRGKMLARGKLGTPSESVELSKRKLDGGNGGGPPLKYTKQESISPTKNKPSDPNLACEDCSLKFDNAIMAIQHFKGKKHAAVIAKKIEEKKSKSSQFNSSRGVRGGGRGRGSDRGGRFNDRGGRGDGGRGSYRGSRDGDSGVRGPASHHGGRGGGRGGGNRFGGFNNVSRFNNDVAISGGGVAAGQLVRALKNFYNQTSAALNYPSTSSSWNSSTSNMYSFNLNDRAQTNYLSKEYFSSSAVVPQSTARDIYNDDRNGRLSFYDDVPLSSSSSGYKFSDSNYGNYGSRDYKRR